MDPGLGRRRYFRQVAHRVVSNIRYGNIITRIMALSAEMHPVASADDTFLHDIIKRRHIRLANRLINNGHDVNAPGNLGRTPLHAAVIAEYLEGVCLLLYHNADVTIQCDNDSVPIMYAEHPDRAVIARVLLPYYYEIPHCWPDWSPLLNFAFLQSPVAIELLSKGVDIDYKNKDGNTAIALSVEYRTPDLFKALWQRVDFDRILRLHIPLFVRFTTHCNFEDDDWLDCLYLILGSSVAFDMVKESTAFYRRRINGNMSFFVVFMREVKRRYIEKEERLKIIYSFLVLDCPVYFWDIDQYLLENTVEETLHFAYFAVRDRRTVSFDGILTKYLVLTHEPTPYTNDYVGSLFLRVRKLFDCIRVAFGYFSLTLQMKRRIINHLVQEQALAIELITMTLADSLNLPSLKELARNAIRTRIALNPNIKMTYQFYDAIKTLPVEAKFKDIISFRRPLYR